MIRTRISLTADVNCLDKSGKLPDRTLAKQEQVKLLAKNFVSGPGLEDVLGCNMPPYARVLDAQEKGQSILSTKPPLPLISLLSIIIQKIVL